MNGKELLAKSATELKAELLSLKKQQFSLRMQAATGQGVKSSDFGKAKKNIARVKTALRAQEIAAGGKK
jgi:large subunit ribosomal protein L29